MLFAVLDTVICGAVAVFAAMVKFYLTGDAIIANFALCVIYALILTSAFYGGLLMFIMLSRSFIIKNNRYYRSFIVAMTFVFIFHLFISLISPLLMAPGLTATLIVQLSRKKQDSFVFNLIETCMAMSVLLYESIMTDGEVFMLIGGGEGRHPDAAAERAGGFDRLFRGKDVDLVAMNAIHAETSEDLELRQSLPDQISAVVTAPVVGFVHQRPVSGRFRLTGKGQLVDAARPGVRQAVDVDVAHAGEQRVGGTFAPDLRFVPDGGAGRPADQHRPAGDADRLDELPPVHGYTLFPSKYACSGYFVWLTAPTGQTPGAITCPASLQPR